MSVMRRVSTAGLLCVAAGLVGAGPATAGPAELVPRSQPRGHGGVTCRTGYPWGERCWARCPRAYEELMLAEGRVRCVPTRTTRLAYGLKLSARYHVQWGDAAGARSQADHAWTFRPRRPAVWLFRQCTLKAPHGDPPYVRILLNPAIPCKRQERALRPDSPPFSLSEDVSLRAAGTLDGGRFTASAIEALHETVWYESNVRQGAPCFNAGSSTSSGSGPTGVPAILLTPARSARFNGLQLQTSPGGTPAAVTYAGTGRLCPPVPAGADAPWSSLDPSQPFNVHTDELRMPKGPEILNEFKPDLDRRFGDAKITLNDTVERGARSTPQRGTYERLQITLELRRCKRQAPPRRCAVPR